MADPTQVEYANYQDQIHDVTDGGYDDQHTPEDVVPVLDEDDIAAARTPKTLPDQPPFPGGPEDTFFMFSYANHVALRL